MHCVITTVQLYVWNVTTSSSCTYTYVGVCYVQPTHSYSYSYNTYKCVYVAILPSIIVAEAVICFSYTLLYSHFPVIRLAI